MDQRGYDNICLSIFGFLSDRTVRICTMIDIGVEARIELISGVGVVRPVVC